MYYLQLKSYKNDFKSLLFHLKNRRKLWHVAIKEVKVPTGSQIRTTVSFCHVLLIF